MANSSWDDFSITASDYIGRFPIACDYLKAQIGSPIKYHASRIIGLIQNENVLKGKLPKSYKSLISWGL